MNQPADQTPPTDRDLIADIRAGRQRRFDVLVARHLPRLLGFLHGYGVPADLVDDVAQEAFLRAFRFLDRYDPRKSFTTWLTVIARNVFLDMVRSRKVSAGPELRENTAGAGASPEEEVVTRTTAADLLAALAPADRMLIEWRIYEDLPFPEIAERLGENEATIRSRFHRLLGKLRLVDADKEKGHAQGR